MGLGGAALPAWLMLAFPLMMIITAVKGLFTAAANPRGKVGLVSVTLVGIGSISSAMALWSWDIVITRPEEAGAVGLYLLADLVLHGLLWSFIAKMCIQIARRRAQA